MTHTDDITSFTEHRRHLRDHFQQIRDTGRPLFVTTNGETSAVVLSPETFDALIEKAELAESLEVIDRGMEDVKAGRGKPLKDAVREIAADLGLPLDQ